MTPLSAYSPLNGARHPRAAGGAALALCAGALALVAGCSTGSTGSTAPAASLTPRQAITLAADQSRRINSMAATISEQLGTSGSMTGTMQLQLKPTLLVEEALRTSAAGQTVSVEAIVSRTVIYIKSPTGTDGKPWIKIPLSGVSGGLGSALRSLLQNTQADNPAEQPLMLAASKNARKVGTQVVNGVQTTRYAGTFSLPAALDALPPAVRTGAGRLQRRAG